MGKWEKGIYFSHNTLIINEYLTIVVKSFTQNTKNGLGKWVKLSLFHLPFRISRRSSS